MSEYLNEIPSFDPALLYSEFEFLNAPPPFSHSDEIEAIEQCIADDRARKTRAGIVIQHRAWGTTEAFRSEEDHLIGAVNRHRGATRTNPRRHPTEAPAALSANAASDHCSYAIHPVLPSNHASPFVAHRISVKLCSEATFTKQEETLRVRAKPADGCPQQSGNEKSGRVPGRLG